MNFSDPAHECSPHVEQPIRHSAHCFADIPLAAFFLASFWETVLGWLHFMLHALAAANAIHDAIRLSANVFHTGRVIASATASLRDGIACVTLGVAIVTIANLVMRISDHVSSDASRAIGYSHRYVRSKVSLAFP